MTITRPTQSGPAAGHRSDRQGLSRTLRPTLSPTRPDQAGSRPPSARGFVPVAKRGVVERPFTWLTGFRRLAIDYASYSGCDIGVQ